MSRSTTTVSTSLFTLSAMALLSQPAAAQDKDGDITPMKGGVKVEVREQGDGWTVALLYPEDGSEPAEVVIVQGEKGILDSPLPDVEKEDLLAELRSDRPVVDPTTADPIESEGLFVVDVGLAEENAQRLFEVSKESTPQYPAQDECGGWNQKTFTLFDMGADANPTKTFNVASGAFSGSVKAEAPMSAGVDSNVTLRYRRASVFAGCIPYKVRFKSAQLGGDASVTPRVTVTGDFSASESFDWKKEVIAPELGALSFMIGPVPVYLPFDLPVTANLRLSADASGHFSTQAEAMLGGEFSVTCTESGCNGGSDFFARFTPPNAENTVLELTGEATAEATLAASVRVSLYSKAVFYGQVGPRAGADVGLWGYAGNTCGDADENGLNEFVDGLLLDADGIFSVRAEIGGLISTRIWDLFPQRMDLAVVDLLGPFGGSSVLEPLIDAPSSVFEDQAGSYTIKMRPCYPYGASTHVYVIGWGDGLTETHFANGSNGKTVLHTYGNPGNKNLTATVEFYEMGGNFDAATTRLISVQ